MEKTRIAGKKCSCCHHLNGWKLEITWSPFTAPRGLMSGHSPLQLFSDPRFGGQVLDDRQKLTRIACCDVKNLPNKKSGQERILVKWMYSEWHLFLSKRHVIPHHWLHIATTKTHVAQAFYKASMIPSMKSHHFSVTQTSKDYLWTTRPDRWHNFHIN